MHGPARPCYGTRVRLPTDRAEIGWMVGPMARICLGGPLRDGGWTKVSRMRPKGGLGEIMRHVRLIGSLAVAVCVLALTAAPTMAHQFVASKLGKIVGHGFEETTEFEPAKMQEWHLGTFTIRCYRAMESGAITELESETLTTTIKFAKCGWYPQKNSLHVAANWSTSGLTIVYHANGYTEAVGNGEGEEVEFKKATILETAAYIKINSTKLCKIVIPEQTIPVAAIKLP